MQNETTRAKPIIAIGCDVDGGLRPTCRLNLEYSDAIVRAGGVPVVLPPLEDDFAIALGPADGVLLTGGDDYDPAAYGQASHRSISPIDPRRHRSDLRLAAAALAAKLPVLGICGGLQLLDIALGGDLVQDIPDLVRGALTHRARREERPARHEIAIVPGTLLSRVLGREKAEVNSYHHQAAGKIGRGLRACARTADGVVEAIEVTEPAPFILAVQWHPERDPDDLSRALFGAFVEAARARARERRA